MAARWWSNQHQLKELDKRGIRWRTQSRVTVFASHMVWLHLSAGLQASLFHSSKTKDCNKRPWRKSKSLKVHASHLPICWRCPCTIILKSMIENRPTIQSIQVSRLLVNSHQLSALHMVFHPKFWTTWVNKRKLWSWLTLELPRALESLDSHLVRWSQK